MRVLVVTNMYPPHHFGGYELSCRDAVGRWRERGHDVTVLTSTMRLPEVRTADEDGVRRALTISFADGDVVVPPRRRRPAIERSNQRALAQALAECRPDVVSVWHMGAMSFGLLTALVEAGVALVYVVCDDWLIYGPTMDRWMAAALRHPRLAPVIERATGVPCHLPDLGRSGSFCFVSELTRRRAEELSRWTFPDASVTPSGVELRLFAPAQDSGARPWTWRLLYVGRVDPRKGIETAVRALDDLPAVATLDVDGRGDAGHRAHLQQVAQTVGVEQRVRFAISERADLASRYRDADAVVFPTEWDEPFGLVPLEAMACGTPVVATGTGGSGEFLVDGENCLIVPPRDPSALAAALVRLAENPALRATLRSGGLRTAARLSVDRFAEVLEERHAGAVATARSDARG